MRFARLCQSIALLLVLAGCAAAPLPAGTEGQFQPEAYLLGPGDQLQITVVGEAELTGAYTVDADGKVSVPLAGVLRAEGATAQALENAIEQRLGANYIRNPNVSVQVTAFRPFFILGEVNNPGQYPYVAGLTIQQAVAVGGGFAPRAQQSVFEVVRPAPSGANTILHLRLLDPVLPGDTVTVRQRLL